MFSVNGHSVVRSMCFRRPVTDDSLKLLRIALLIDVVIVHSDILRPCRLSWRALLSRMGDI